MMFRGVGAIGIVLPDMDDQTKELLCAFIAALDHNAEPPGEVRASFEKCLPDIDGKPQTILKARWRTKPC
jgi:hypothetical protein